jgi:hypothetical protein
MPVANAKLGCLALGASIAAWLCIPLLIVLESTRMMGGPAVEFNIGCAGLLLCIAAIVCGIAAKLHWAGCAGIALSVVLLALSALVYFTPVWGR